MKYINNYIGTVSKSDYNTVRELLTPILRNHLVGLRGRGRGSRGMAGGRGGRSVYQYSRYQAYLPFDMSSKIALYIRVQPTNKFLMRYQKSGVDQYKTINEFEGVQCQILRNNIRDILKTHGVKLEGVV